MQNLPLQNYSSAKREFVLYGGKFFGKSMTLKNGVVIIIQSEKGTIFGAFFSARLPFANGKV
jgi:hypothetical protein